MPEERFIDNANETITDTLTGLTWFKKDSSQMTGRWMHLEKSGKLAQEMNALKFGGFDDWRIPKLEDVKTIFDKGFRNRDFGRTEIYIPSIFEAGGADCTWTDTVNGDRAMLYSFVKGRSAWINKLGDGPFAVRLVRGARKEGGSS
ncbi:MAG: hypothetical protein A3K09_05550 [Nitrospinae bacterium RIFCSPLOWO2_12_FULL_47_7]|nr:MAG: hypothetical protein A3K09_05550 [Nitrospinae bacterium RIFCSPLOWO2_12_FULL_47_7]